MASVADIEEFLDAYVTTALWSSNDESDPDTGGEPLDQNYGPEDIEPETMERMRADCLAFLETCGELITDETCLRYGPDFGTIGHAGHDFWLTRNRHGAGFWDGDWRSDVETLLDDAAKAFGEVWLFVGEDGTIDGH